jgi:RNA polymerase sigma-70 factor (ECF subfamily)
VADDALVEAVSDDIEQVYRTEAQKMWRALVGYSGDRQIADDAVAEAFARALHHQQSINDLRAWLWRVAFRLAAADIRKPNQPPEAAGTLPEPTPEAVDLVTALRRLPERQRIALVLHDYADRPTAEVAATLGCSTATVYVHLSRGRKRLRELLETDHA